MKLKTEQARLNRNLEGRGHRGICVVLEGRDTAGKSSTIREVTHYLNPRHFSVHLSAMPSKINHEKLAWLLGQQNARLQSDRFL